jgi:hypothetical protein
MINKATRLQRPLRYLIILCLLLPFFISTEQAYACSCAPPDPPDVSLGRATAVFSGKVTDIATPSSFPRVAFNSYYPFVHLYSDIGTTKITFTVTEVWRGEPYEMIIINTSSSGASCGLEGVSVGAEWAPVAVVVLSETARKLPKEAVDASVKATLVDVNKQLESHERLARVIIVAVDWTTQNGMLTPTLKIKRDVLEERYRPLLDEQHTAFVVWE